MSQFAKKEQYLSDLHDISERYIENWNLACDFEGASRESDTVIFSDSNEFAKICISLHKEMLGLKNFIDMIPD